MRRTERHAVALRVLSLLALAAAIGVTSALAQNASVEDNPNYPARNPFYFEGKIDYELLRIDQPATAWEYMQRGIHSQDDREDYRAAIEDYRKALELNNVDNGSCQIVDSLPAKPRRLGSAALYVHFEASARLPPDPRRPGRVNPSF